MRIGGQHNLMTVRRRVQVGTNAANEPVFVWQDWRPDVFCEVTVKRGKEQFDPVGKKRYSEDIWQFRTRYDEVRGLDSTMTITHEGNVYDIKAILPDGQRRNDCVIEATLQDGALGGLPLLIQIKSTIWEGMVGQPYDPLPVDVTGGVAPYIFTAESGTLPPGLTIDPTSGIISGDPIVAGTYQVSVQVSDAEGSIETLPTFNIVIEDA
jgi:head-tail adaptor